MEQSETSNAFFRFARWHMLPLESVTLTGGFWSRWQETNRRVTLGHGYRMLEQAGNLHNFRVAAGRADGAFRGVIFMDSDVYKWLEAVAYELHTHADPDLRQRADDVIALVAAAQQADGYLNTYVQIVPGSARWADLDFGHELYCAGHLFQAAAAYTRATGTTALLTIATRFADLLADTFGPGKRPGTAGHPVVEMALVELYRVTGNPAYLHLAKHFIDERGKGVMRGMGWMKAEYHQDRVPVRQADIVEGHAVRAMYLNAGITDLYLETGEEALLAALCRQWHDMTHGKVFLTGGVGSRYEGEAFGDPYELPPDVCYCETCAAIGSVMWNWRMLRVTGEARYADLLEKTLYNGVLSGMALDGRHFFYINPLLSRGGYARKEWHEVSCCPPNLMRLLASLGQLFATTDSSGIQVHLYNTATLTAPAPLPVRLSMQTDYPWQGQVKLTLQEAPGSAWQLRLRVPAWCARPSVAVNGETLSAPRMEAGYLVIERAWQAGDVVALDLPMEARLIEPHPRIDAVRGSVAIQRGPVVYCVEAADHAGVNLLDVSLDPARPLEVAWQADPGLMAIRAAGYLHDHTGWEAHLYQPAAGENRSPRTPVALNAIPYYAWANRGENPMRVWIPRAES